MASSHRIILPNTIIRSGGPARAKYTTLPPNGVSLSEVRTMRTMRTKGYLLREIAAHTNRSIRTVWSLTAHVTHPNWLKDREVQRPRRGCMVHLVDHNVR